VDLTDAGLSELKPLKNLKSLNLLHTEITGAGVDQLREIPNLLVEFFNDRRPITESELAEINAELPDVGETEKALAAMERIRLLGGNVTRDSTSPAQSAVGVGFRHQNRFSDKSVHLLMPLHELTTLRLIGSEITDVGIMQLRELAGIQSLHLGSTQITDQ